MTSAPSRDGEDVEDLVVADLHRIVGHVDLERGVAVLDQRRQFLPQRLWRRIGHDQVEGIVDYRLRASGLVVLLDHLAQRHAAMLGREGNDGRGAAERGGNRAGIEVVGAHHAHPRLLLDVAVAVDAARQDELATSIDLARSRSLQVRPDLDHLAILDRDVALGLPLGGDDAGVANDQIVVSHVPTPPPWRDGPWPPDAVRGARSFRRVPSCPSPSATSRAPAVSDS